MTHEDDYLLFLIDYYAILVANTVDPVWLYSTNIITQGVFIQLKLNTKFR